MSWGGTVRRNLGVRKNARPPNLADTGSWWWVGDCRVCGIQELNSRSSFYLRLALKEGDYPNRQRREVALPAAVSAGGRTKSVEAVMAPQHIEVALAFL